MMRSFAGSTTSEIVKTMTPLKSAAPRGESFSLVPSPYLTTLQEGIRVSPRKASAHLVHPVIHTVYFRRLLRIGDNYMVRTSSTIKEESCRVLYFRDPKKMLFPVYRSLT